MKEAKTLSLPCLLHNRCVSFLFFQRILKELDDVFSTQRSNQNPVGIIMCWKQWRLKCSTMINRYIGSITGNNFTLPRSEQSRLRMKRALRGKNV